MVKTRTHTKTTKLRGIHLFTEGNRIKVAVETDAKQWVTVIEEAYDGDYNISHIVEPAGIENAIRQAEVTE